MPLKSQYPPVPIPEIPFSQIVLDAIRKNASLYPSRPAVIDGENEHRSITFGEIYVQAHSVAAFLHGRGFGHGDVAAVTVPNCWEFSVFFLGASLNGGAISGASPLFTDPHCVAANSDLADELERQFKDSECSVVFTSDEGLEKVRTAAKSCPRIKTIIVLSLDPSRQLPLGTFSYEEAVAAKPMFNTPKIHYDLNNDVQLLPYSSGTTGSPKGVMLTHKNLNAMFAVLRYHFENVITPRIDANWQWDKEVMLLFLPYSHIYGFFLMILGLVRGSTAVVLRHFDQRNFLNALQKYKVRMLSVVPPILVFLAKDHTVSEYDVSSLEYVLSGAAPAGKDLCEELRARHPNLKHIVQGYGMTEMSMSSHLPVLADPEETFGNAGKLIANCEGKFVDLKTDKECGPNERGELWIRSPTVMKGYLNKPKETKETIDEQGWLHTGDIGYHDKNGYMFIIDRLKELIKVKGFQVPPAELEDLLLSHPKIQDVAVIGVPDKESGELPRAYVVRNDPSLSEVEVTEFVKGKMSHYKQLKGGVEFVNEIPKSPSGKILRRLLRERAQVTMKKAKI